MFSQTMPLRVFGRRGRWSRGDPRRLPILEAIEERCLLSTAAMPSALMMHLVPMALIPTQTSLISPAPVRVGNFAVVTAVVTATSGTPSGQVVFNVDGVDQAPVSLITVNGLQEASFSSTSLAVGPHGVTARFLGDSSFAASGPSASVNLQVVSLTDTNVAMRVPAPVGIAQLPSDGMFYVTEAGKNRIAQIDPSTNQVTESAVIPTSNAAPFGIAAGSSVVYFTEYLGNKIGKYDPTTGIITEYPIPTTDSGPWGIAVGPTGAVFFTEFNAGRIGVLNPITGTITDSLPEQFVGGSPAGLVAGPSGDSHLYYVDTQGNVVGSIDASFNGGGDPTSLNVIAIPLPSTDPSPIGVTIGPDSKVWFTEANASAIGRWNQADPNPATSITEYDLPSGNSVPLGIAPGPVGSNTIYFTDFTGNSVNSFDIVTQVLGVTKLTSPLAGPFGITTNASDGSVWFTETIANAFGTIPSSQNNLLAVQPLGTIANGLAETTLPGATGGPFGITEGPDGAVWFTESASSTIDRYDLTTGVVTDRIPTTTPNSRPLGITLGPGGTLYFTESSGYIGSYNPTTGIVGEVAIPTADSGPLAIVNCPSCGNLVFFTESIANKIGRLDTATNTITEFDIPTSDSLPSGIVIGPDNNVWFTEANGNRIGMFNPATPNSITEYVLPSGSNSPTQIVAGPDGKLYFSTSGSSIGRIDPANPSAITMISINTGLAGNYGITAGPDGNLYLTGFFGDRILAFNPESQLWKNLPIPTSLAGAVGIVAASGNLYFTEYLAGNLGEVQLVANPAAQATVTTIDPGTPNPSNFGEAVTFTAHVAAAQVPGLAVSPFATSQLTGSVTFTIDGVDQTPVALQGPGLNADYTATLIISTLKPGPHAISARYDGDPNYAPSSAAAPVAQTVNRVQTTTLLEVGQPNPSAQGQPVQFQVTMLPQAFTGDQPNGHFFLFVDGVAVVSFPLTGTGSGYFGTVSYAFPLSGTHQVAAAYGGDAEYASSALSTAVTQSVTAHAKWPTTVTLNVTPGTVNPGQPVTFMAVLHPNFSSAPPGLVGVEPATGSVIFAIDGHPLGPVPLTIVNGVGEVATLTFPANLSIGTHQIVAAYTGDANYAASPVTGPKPLVVVATPVAGPTVTAVTRYGYHWTPTEIVITFSTALDPARAQNVANYAIRLAGTTKLIPILTARYNPTTHQVFLLPAKLLGLRSNYVLTVNGTAPYGLTSPTGVYLSGIGTNHPGTSYVTHLTEANLRWAPAPALPPVIPIAATATPRGPASLFRRPST